MNEDERGITPPDVTAITIERKDGKPVTLAGGAWLVTIEQGNGDVIKTVELTEAERLYLVTVIDFPSLAGPVVSHCGFVDFSRRGPESGQAA